MPLFRACLRLAQNFAGEGKQCDVSCSFDGGSQFALVFGASAGLATGANFAIFMNIAAQKIGIFVVDFLAFFGAEGTGARARIKVSPTTGASATTTSK